MLSKNQLREIRSLHLKKFREARGLFIAEGAKTVSEILATWPQLIDSLFASEQFLSRNQQPLNRNHIKYFEVNEEELKSISLQSAPNQVLAICRKPTDAFFPQEAGSFSFYLDDVRDPGNFGTILRICDWFGARVLYCSPESCELYNPKVIQASMGAFLRVKTVYISLENLISRKTFSHVYATVLDGDNLYTQKLEKGIVIIGNEANGISPENLKKATHKITIPAHPGNGSESLNAAMAAAITASEFFRRHEVQS